MANQRYFSVKFGGVGASQYKCGRLSVKYFNIFSQADIDSYYSVFPGWNGGKVENYDTIFANYLYDSNVKDSSPIIENYSYTESSPDSDINIGPSDGLAARQGTSSTEYSIYRREFEVYERPGYKIFGYYYNNNFYKTPEHEEADKILPREGILFVDEDTKYFYEYNAMSRTFNLIDRARVFKGEWEPVVIKTNQISLYDYNIKNGKSYQYMMYPDTIDSDSIDEEMNKSSQVFANSNEQYMVWKQDEQLPGQGRLVQGQKETSNTLGAPIVINWEEWSICELIPETNVEDIPIVKNAYRVNPEQVWLFKYSLETGSQTQNIARTDFQTLGQFPKIGFGKTNYSSGEVSALLGSEIVLSSQTKYIERLKKSRLGPLSTNERAEMLAKWKEFVASRNPKLLKDIKGQSWIVQVISGSNSPKNFYANQPDTISFQWKQVEDTKNVIIYSEVGSIYKEKEEYGSAEWEPIFKNRTAS